MRYFNVFGPNQDPTSEYAVVIPKFITAMLLGEHPVIYGDGLQSRNFPPVVNVVEANLLAVDAEDAAGEVFNVACGKRYNLLELIEALNRILDTSLTPIHAPPRPGDVRHSWADISKARSVLGYRVEAAFEEGLKRAVEWYKSN